VRASRLPKSGTVSIRLKQLAASLKECQRLWDVFEDVPKSDGIETTFEARRVQRGALHFSFSVQAFLGLLAELLVRLNASDFPPSVQGMQEEQAGGTTNIQKTSGAYVAHWRVVP
jgi:hypothetical protein